MVLLVIVFIAGGDSDDGGARKDIVEYDGEDWKAVGQLQVGRWGTAVTKFTITDKMMDFCN